MHGKEFESLTNALNAILCTDCLNVMYGSRKASRPQSKLTVVDIDCSIYQSQGINGVLISIFYNYQINLPGVLHYQLSVTQE